MFKTVQINSSNANDEALKELYESSFPKEERIPYEEVVKYLDIMNIDFTAYYEGEKLLAITIVNRLPKYNFGSYFAVQKEMRGKGLGQKIQSIILEKYRQGNPFVVDVESPLQIDAPNLDLRKRRHDFYLRCGLKDTGFYYTYNGVSFTIMSNSEEPFTQKDYEEIFSYFRSFKGN